MTSKAAGYRSVFVMVLVTAVSGCSNGDTQKLADAVVIEDQNIQDIEVLSSKDIIAVTETLAMSAIDGVSGADITSSLRWASSDTAVATVNGAGVVTGVTDGIATISASIGTLEGAFTLTVSAAGLLSIEVTSNQGPIDVCTDAQLTATGTFADGRLEDVTTSADWQSLNTVVAQFDDAVPGLLRTRSAGNVDVTASLASVTSAILPVVISDSLSAVSAQLAADSIDIGATTQVSVLGSFGGISQDITANATFTSATESVATVDQAGVVSGVAAGTSLISATCNQVQGEVTVTVLGSSTTLISLDAVGSAPFEVPLNSTLQLQVEATFEDQSTRIVTEEAFWSIALGSAGAASVSNVEGSKGLVTPNFVGSTIVRALFDTEETTIVVDVVQ